MPKPQTHSLPEVSDIIRQVLSKVSITRYTKDQQKVLTALIRCRTAALGGHLISCARCVYREQSYNSCLNRHCPKCKGGKIYNWVKARQEELLPVKYFHTVFSIPSELRGVFYQNKKLCYDILFRASSETLSEVTKNNHNARPGFFGVLHTWNQELLSHPHIHYVIAAGGITPDGWRSIGSDNFFLPVRVLSKVFRGKLIYYLKEAYREKKLNFFGNLSYLENPRDFEHLISQSCHFDWAVYSKRPFAGPEAVVKYLSLYTHRIGISNKRLLRVSPDEVRFSARHKTKKGKKIVVTVKPQEFVRRFLIHTVPKGFQRIRHFGFLTNRERNNTVWG